MEYLSRDGKHNIWGIACEIYNDIVESLETVKNNGIISYSGFSRSLPPKVAIAFGITEVTEHYINFIINEDETDIDDIAIELIDRFKLVGSPIISYKGNEYPYYD